MTHAPHRFAVFLLPNDLSGLGDTPLKRDLMACIRRFNERAERDGMECDIIGDMKAGRADGFAVMVDDELQAFLGMSILPSERGNVMQADVIGARPHPRLDGQEIGYADYFDDLLAFAESHAAKAGCVGLQFLARRGHARLLRGGEYREAYIMFQRRLTPARESEAA